MLHPNPIQPTTPKAYLQGFQNFYGRDFYVDTNVLIPRPESEQIIDAVLNLAGKPFLPGVKPAARKLSEHPTIVDVGTGSGCLAITIAKELPEAKIIATDISKDAIKIAQKNAKIHDVHPTFIISHLLEKVNQVLPTSTSPSVIVANLPYVDESWPWLDKDSLSHEPSLALYADDHGLSLIKELIKQTAIYHNTYLVLEADPSQHQSIIQHASDYSLIEIRGFILVFHIK